MKDGVASKTAHDVARRRAAHQLLDCPVVFEDPLANKILGNTTSLALQRSREFVVARSRYTEDELARFVAEGGSQYVVLGAGLDTFAYRNPYSPELRVIEVDHSDTQAWKQDLLRASGIGVPESVTFVPVDFEKEKLQDVLGNVPAWRQKEPSFFSWLGVTPYLTNAAFTTTLAFIAMMPRRSVVVFDYAVPPASLDAEERKRFEALIARAAGGSEEFRSFFEPQTLSKLLRELGFTHIEDLGQKELNRRYFHNRSDSLRIENSINRILTARI